jgi:hypothetical protein
MASGTRGSAILRCGSKTYQLHLAHRDIFLLDGTHFAPKGAPYRKLLGLDFLRGTKIPGRGEILAVHPRTTMLRGMELLLAELSEQRDWLRWDYSYSFSSEPHRSGGGGMSGFQVDGLCGCVWARPAGYCDVELMAVGQDGHGHVVQVIDLRKQLTIHTDNWGVLKVHRRSRPIGWFDVLPPLIEWLTKAKGVNVEIIND